MALPVLMCVSLIFGRQGRECYLSRIPTGTRRTPISASGIIASTTAVTAVIRIIIVTVARRAAATAVVVCTTTTIILAAIVQTQRGNTPVDVVGDTLAALLAARGTRGWGSFIVAGRVGFGVARDGAR